MRSVLVCLVLLAGASQVQSAEGRDKEYVYSGTVVFDATGRPAAGVSISIERWKYRWGTLFYSPARFALDAKSVFTVTAVTDENGEFRVVAPDRANSLAARLPGYYEGFDLDRKHLRRNFEVRISPLVATQNRPVYDKAEKIRNEEYRLLSELRTVAARLIDHKDRNSLAEFWSLQAYLDEGVISEEEFMLFQQHRESLNDPCDTEPEFRITWRGDNLGYASTDTPIGFYPGRCFATGFDGPAFTRP